jgi:hypothetical protein
MQHLYERGARNFKFVDRTFNLKVDDSARILHFFLDRLAPGHDDPAGRLFVHFEVIPDHLPERLRELIMRFPAGSLQLEVGIQSFNEASSSAFRAVRTTPGRRPTCAGCSNVRRRTCMPT